MDNPRTPNPPPVATPSPAPTPTPAAPAPTSSDPKSGMTGSNSGTMNQGKSKTTSAPTSPLKEKKASFFGKVWNFYLIFLFMGKNHNFVMLTQGRNINSCCFPYSQLQHLRYFCFEECYLKSFALLKITFAFSFFIIFEFDFGFL